jgi:hypothetical protein
MLFHFAQNVVELASRDIALHLIIPFVILPTVQPRCQLGALFKRELFDSGFDFGEAHFGNITTARLAFQVAAMNESGSQENRKMEQTNS